MAGTSGQGRSEIIFTNHTVLLGVYETRESRTYSDVTRPLRKLTNWKTKFVWSKECEHSFQELKKLLCCDTVMANYKLDKETRLYVDHGPAGVAGTIAQKHRMPETMEEAWRPVNHTSRALTPAEQGYSKVEGESLAVYSQIMTNRRSMFHVSMLQQLREDTCL